MKIEKELKLELTRAEYERLRAKWGEPRELRVQRNLYFEDGEDSSLWARNGLAIRLREEGGSWTLAVKGSGREEAGGWCHRPEWETKIEGGLFAGLLLGGELMRRAVEELMGELPEILADSEPALRGELVNRRGIYRLSSSGALVELDSYRLPDGAEGFELELENDDPEFAARAEAELRGSFEALGLEWRPSSTSKRRRFEDALRNVD